MALVDVASAATIPAPKRAAVAITMKLTNRTMLAVCGVVVRSDSMIRNEWKALVMMMLLILTYHSTEVVHG